MRVRTRKVTISAGMAGVLAAAGFAFTLEAQQPPSGPPQTTAAHRALIDEYCVSCHDEDEKKAGLALDTLAAQDVPRHPDVWEKVVRKLRARQMPPVGKPRPDDATYDAVISSLETSLDRAAERIRIPAGRPRSGGSPEPNTRTPSAISSRSTSMSPRCCPPTSPVMASTM